MQFDDHFHNMLTEILRVPCLSEEQWDQASLPVRFAGLGVNQTKVIAASAYLGSCTLTKDLVAAMLGFDVDKFKPAGLSTLLTAHEATTGKVHTWSSLCDEKSVQQKLSTERHVALFYHLEARSTPPLAQPVTRLIHAAYKRLPRFRAWPQSNYKTQCMPTSR